MHEHDHDHEQFIRLIIVTTGEDVDHRFNVHEPIKAVKALALHGLPPGTNPDEFVLEFEGQPLDNDKKIIEYIEQFSWKDGTVLELRPVPVVI